MNNENTMVWPLDTGNWDSSNGSFQLVRTHLGYAVSQQLPAADLAHFMRMRKASTDGSLFPPEFNYSPVDGSTLAGTASPAAESGWIPPFGARSVTMARSSEVLGLRKSQRTLALANPASYHADSAADASLPVPPPGEYQFISGQFGTSAEALLALDPAKGSLFVWLPESARWQAVEGSSNSLLAESRIARASWRCELLSGFHSTLLLGTEAGLARLVVDLPALRYQVSYCGNGVAIGAPVTFNQQVWLPLQQPDGSLHFAQTSADGQSGATIKVSNAPASLGSGSPPVAYGRMAVWLYGEGQLHLQQQADGSVSAQFIAWPAQVTPEFSFGSPYQDAAGSLWQLCFDHQAGNYLYVELGKLQPQRQPALSPRFCSGSINYRFASKLKKNPWEEPEHGDDGAASENVIPLLEVGDSGVVGLKLGNTQALASLLENPDRMRLLMIWDDDDTETAFHTGVVAQPWHMRLFTYQDKLWAYHPQLARIDGWTLAP